MIRLSTIRNNIPNALAVAFMVVYVSVLIGNPVHLLNHAANEELVCADPENACHLNIVHGDILNGCDHESHLIEDNIPHCDLCAIATESKVTLFNQNIGSSTINSIPYKFAKLTVGLIDGFLKSVDNRGPPFCS